MHKQNQSSRLMLRTAATECNADRCQWRYYAACFFRSTSSPLLQMVSLVLPLTHAINLARPLLNDVVPAHFLWHAAVLLGYALVGFYVSLVLFRRRLSQ